MAYKGKFRDTCPIICAAGIRNKPNYSAKDSLQEFSVQDGVQALKTDFHIAEKEHKPIKLPQINANSRSPWIFTESRDLIRPPVQTRYRQLMNDLKESTYSSYWNKILGTTIDSVPAFPEGMSVDGITFGEPNKYDVTIKELIQPCQSFCQHIHEEGRNGKYCSQKVIDRGYSPTSFNPKTAFGKYYGYDKRGLKVKCLLQCPEDSSILPLNKIQADWLQKNTSKLGKCSKANQILETLPDGYTFGRPYQRSMYAVEDLLREANIPVSTEVKDIRIWLVSLNRLKMQIQRKLDTPDILYEKMRFADKNNVGFISFGQLLEIMRCYELLFNISNIKALMEHLEIVVNDQVDYVRFLDSATTKIILNKVCDLTSDQVHETTTYQDACQDYFIPDENVGRPNAGLPSHRLDTPTNPFSESYIELSDHSDVKACVQPSIFMQYSLSHRDFYCPRDENFMRKLFCTAGYISEENFAKLWKIGVETNKSGKVCIQTFRDLLVKYCPIEKEINVDEILC